MTRRGVVGALTATLLALVLVGIVPAGPASATSCAGTGSIASAIDGGAAVFVGTVVSTTNRGRWATFAVEEVWSGDVADTQAVRAGLAPERGSGRFSGIAGEHTFEPGQRYLVEATVPPPVGLETGFANDDYPFEPGDLVDGPCSMTTPWTDSLAVDRPASARTIDRSEPIAVVGNLPDPKPVGGTGDTLLGLSRPWQLALGVALGLGAALLASVWWRSRHGSSAPVP